MWIWTVVGILLVVLLIVVIVKLLKISANVQLPMHPGMKRCWQFDNSRRPGRCIALMSFLRIPAIMRVVAFSAVLILAGDIIADSIADTREGHCVSETSQSDPHQEKAPCSHCSCAVHIGAVVVADLAMRLTVDLQAGIFFLTSDGAVPPRLSSSIDHPPQLA